MSIRSCLIASIAFAFSLDALAMGHACFYESPLPNAGAPDPTLFSEQYASPSDVMQWMDGFLTNSYSSNFPVWQEAVNTQKAPISPGWTAFFLGGSAPQSSTFYMDSWYRAMTALCDPEFGPECWYFYWPGPYWSNMDACYATGFVTL